MNFYQVGGAVRDKLLGQEVRDRDWVVVGATTEQMLALGYRQVGADFPVFLHPQSNEEYALARLERKSGHGYHGFEVRVQDVTLEEDLSRRDLTINAMALNDAGELVDPFSGEQDLRNKVLRHVGPAFSEDPVRILRVLRFLARFGPSWRIAESTRKLIAGMVAAGEASHLVAERVWKETERALMEPHPELFVQGLLDFALTRLACFKAFQAASESRLGALSAAARQGASAEARFAVAFASEELGLQAPGIPTSFLVTAKLFLDLQSESSWLAQPGQSGEQLLEFLTRAQVFKQHDLFEGVLQAAEAHGADTRSLRDAVARCQAVDTKAITRSMPPGPAVGAAVKAARLDALAGS